MTEKELRQNIQNKKNKLNQKRRGILFYEILEETKENIKQRQKANELDAKYIDFLQELLNKWEEKDK